MCYTSFPLLDLNFKQKFSSNFEMYSVINISINDVGNIVRCMWEHYTLTDGGARCRTHLKIIAITFNSVSLFKISWLFWDSNNISLTFSKPDYCLCRRIQGWSKYVVLIIINITKYFLICIYITKYFSEEYWK